MSIITKILLSAIVILFVCLLAQNDDDEEDPMFLAVIGVSSILTIIVCILLKIWIEL